MSAASARPDLMVAVVGTATEVGKTWVSCQVLAALRSEGVEVAARKPAQSFEEGDAATDADLLAAATGEAAEAVCPPQRWYPIPMAPPMASAALGRGALTGDDLRAELAWEPGTAVGIVETAGGVASPMADDADCAELVASLGPDLVLLVADAGLGTINGVRSSLTVLRGAGLDRVLVHLNRFEPGSDLHGRNLEWLVGRDGLDVTVEIDDLVRRLSPGSAS